LPGSPRSSNRRERVYANCKCGDARLDNTIFLALPISWKGTLVQYAGRLHRLHPDKKEVRILDYVDRHVPTLARMFNRRLRGYRTIGFEQSEPPVGYEAPTDDTVTEWIDETLRPIED